MYKYSTTRSNQGHILLFPRVKSLATRQGPKDLAGFIEAPLTNISKATVIPIAKGATETEEVSTAHVRIVWAKIAVKINSTIAA
uniref:Uncharacterized protein n=1 Tax=Meloidogyne incognita TaxID=6306 RepID=A0A914MHR9_MELIC